MMWPASPGTSFPPSMPLFSPLLADFFTRTPLLNLGPRSAQGGVVTDMPLGIPYGM